MGVPKFYRWISERYPCLSDVIKEFQIPDFDNLYLDMNGIIHPCSHPNDDDPHFRITEEDIFANICYYIEFLFKMIKPKKVFFMAVDGVAPRAKMNQQRGRRFRTAKAAIILEEEARASGEELPKEARFDSNCITPGTAFMNRLHTCLQNFVVHKVSTDKLWQGIRIYLSGHETPGEGEHKIMDFIRYEKSQPGYNPNTRHCLYGLDADLIMLGLCSHEPYFSLLREEVKFGGNKKKQKRITTPEETTFHLLHVSLLRDYLSHEFSPVKDKISFPYNLENIVDDFVLMSFLVGNDFIPHLPQLHIHHDALPVLFETYINVLPTIGGYINEAGQLNLERFQAFLTKLSEYDFKKFEELSDDFTYLEGKSSTAKEVSASEKNTSDILANLGFSNLSISKTAEYDSSTDDEADSEEESTLELEFNMHKADYYMNKLDYEEVTPEVLKDQAEGYVRAIQWNLYYYYNGVASWSWYYPHHYSPYISDLKNFKSMEIKFDLSRPFMPFQQLLAVLPKLSKDLLPESYQKLMCEKDSPLIDFYPEDFVTDLNGKQQEWEAVVLIPFINEKLLLKSSELANKELNDDENRRNIHGPHLLYTYDKKSCGSRPSFLPGHYPALYDTHFKLIEIEKDFFRLPSELIYKGLCKGVMLDKFMLGFPTLRSLKHSAVLKNEKVKVFQMVSMKENMMLTIEEQVDEDINKICEKVLGKPIYVSWPHLKEALVVAVTDGETKFSCEKEGSSGIVKVIEKKMTVDERKIWHSQCHIVEENNHQRWGILLGDIKFLVNVRCFSGSKFVLTKEGKVTEEKQFDGFTSNYALQTTVSNLEVFSPDAKTHKSVEDVFQAGSTVFLLIPQYYGSKGSVLDNDVVKNKGSMVINIELENEPDLTPVIQNQEQLMLEQFMPGYIAAQQLGVESHFISRITGTFLVQTSPKGASNPNRVNIGLNLKFNRRNEEVQGFSKKVDNQWLYSEEAVRILGAFLEKFSDFFDRLYRYINCDVVHIEDLYPGGEGPKLIKDIASWLKEQACSAADRQTCGIEKLDYGIVGAIDRTVSSFTNIDVYHTKKTIPPSQLYSPYLCRGIFMPDSQTTYYLFDRVVNVCPSSSVPLGMKGTIIGIQSAEKETDVVYEVLFDKEFSGGLSIGGSGKKGYRMPPNSLINISHGERLRKEQSPLKRSRANIPRLNRTGVFDSAVKQLETFSPPKQILQKKQPLQNKPFYKADTDNMFQTTAQDAMPSSWSSSKQFVTPKASRLSGSFVSPNMQRSDFENFWTDLKKTSESTNSPKKQNANIDVVKPTSDETYGQKVSVEELFQVAQNQIEKNHQQNVKMMQRVQAPPDPHIEPTDLLRQTCLKHFKAPALYSYHNYGMTNLHIANILLPNGQRISSIPCPSKLEAAADASTTALASLKSLPHGNKPDYNNTMVAHGAKVPIPTNPIPIHQPSRFPTDCRPVYMCPPPPFMATNFQQPPPPLFKQQPPHFPLPFNPMQFDTPVMRHPQPMHPHIPDSYVKANQMLLLDPEARFHTPDRSSTIPSLANSHLLQGNDIFHLPRGGTAMIRDTKKEHQKGTDVSNSMFIPVQVMKQAIKTPSDPNLSNSEWPDLPPPPPVKEIKVVKTPSVSATDRTKPFSEIAKSIGQSPISNNNNGKLPVSHPTGMTVLKRKGKRRIAANFQNPD